MATVPWRHLDSVRTFTEQLARGMCNTLLFLFVAFAASYLGCLSVCVCVFVMYIVISASINGTKAHIKTFQRKSYHHHHHRFIFAVAFRFFIARFKLIWELIIFFSALCVFIYSTFFSPVFTAERISWIHLLTRYFWFIGDFFPIFVCVFLEIYS